MKHLKLIILLLAIAILLASCEVSADEYNASNNPSNGSVVVDGDATSYVLPVKTDLSGVNLKEKEVAVRHDGNTYYIEFAVDNMTLTMDSLYSFASFISIEANDGNTPYTFKTDKQLKIIDIDTGVVSEKKYYVRNPEVFDAFEDLILSLTFESTEDNVNMLFVHNVGFEYEGQSYYVLRDGTVYCGDKKATTKLSDEQTVLLFAYKSAYSYACATRTSSLSNYSAIAVKENGSTSSITDTTEMQTFLTTNFTNGSFSYICDVNVKGKSYGDEKTSFTIYNDVLSENAFWYKIYTNGAITHDANPGLYKTDDGNYEGLITPIVQIITIAK